MITRSYDQQRQFSKLKAANNDANSCELSERRTVTARGWLLHFGILMGKRLLRTQTYLR